VKSSKLSAHLRVERYGDFWLTEAVRPGVRVPVVPREGFRVGTYRDRKAGLRVPVLAAAVSREHLFDTFLALLDPLGEVVDAVLETSHHGGRGHRDLFRDHIDLPVLKSHFCDFEDLLLHDGCTGVAVIGTEGPVEVQFDEHKLLVVYAHDLEPFQEVLRDAGINRDDSLRLITEGEHLHSSDPRHDTTFSQLCCRLGVSEAGERVSW
jgi:hypothetical protein